MSSAVSLLDGTSAEVVAIVVCGTTGRTLGQQRRSVSSSELYLEMSTFRHDEYAACE